MRVLNKPGPFLVIAPLSTIEHWRREVEGWTDMNCCVYYDTAGGAQARQMIRELEWYYFGCARDKLKFHVLVTTYEVFMTDLVEFASVSWRCAGRAVVSARWPDAFLAVVLSSMKATACET